MILQILLIIIKIKINPIQTGEIIQVFLETKKYIK